jgi:hypothetical protein
MTPKILLDVSYSKDREGYISLTVREKGKRGLPFATMAVGPTGMTSLIINGVEGDVDTAFGEFPELFAKATEALL